MFNETVFNCSGEVENAKTRDTVEVQVDLKDTTRPEVQNQHPERQRQPPGRYTV